MTITDLLAMTPTTFKETFFSRNSREENYPDMLRLVDAVKGEGFQESSFGQAITLLTPEEYMEVVLFFLDKSVEESISEKSSGFYTLWRRCELEAIRLKGALSYVVETLPVAFEVFNNLPREKLYRYTSVSKSAGENSASELCILDLYLVDCQLKNPSKIKELQAAAKKCIIEDVTTHMTDFGKNELTDAHLEMLEKMDADLQEKVNDEDFDGIMFARREVLDKTATLSRLLREVLDGPQLGTGGSGSLLDKLFEGEEDDTQEENSNKKHLH